YSYSLTPNATSYVLGANVTGKQWIAGTSGLWSVGTNWSGGTAPTASDDVIISVAGSTVTVTVDATGAQFANSLMVGGDEKLSITGSSLTLTNASSINDTLLVSGGALTTNAGLTTNALNLSGGSINGTGSLTVTSAYTHTGGSINLLTGPVMVTQANGSLSV